MSLSGNLEVWQSGEWLVPANGSLSAVAGGVEDVMHEVCIGRGNEVKVCYLFPAPQQRAGESCQIARLRGGGPMWVKGDRSWCGGGF